MACRARGGNHSGVLQVQPTSVRLTSHHLRTQSTPSDCTSGNESKREVNPDYIIGTSLPAAATGFMSVAALKRLESGTPYDIAPFSNRGGDVAAPGVDVESAAAGG